MLHAISSLLLLGLPAAAAVDDGFVEVTMPSKPDVTSILLTSEAPASVLETRSVPLKLGTNRLRFDWSRERVDENSVRFAVHAATGTARVAARTKVQRLAGMLYFDVDASEETTAILSTRYLLHGIGWRVDYVGMLPAKPDPTNDALDLRLSVEVNNTSGMDLEGARIAFAGGVLESLSLKNGERRQVEILRLEKIPVTRRYIYDPSRFGGTPRIELEIVNTPEAPFARELFPAGKIRIFTQTNEGGPSLLGEDVFPGTPRGEKAKFTIGNARDLTVERTVLHQANENERRDRWNKVVAYDQRAKVRFKIHNGLDRDTTLRIVEKPGAPLEIVSCTAPYKKKKAGTIEIEAPLIATQETIVEIEWVRKNLF